MSTDNVIKDLIETLEDGRKGFSDAATKLASDGHTDLAHRFEQLAEQRQRFTAELRVAANEAGFRVSEDGSIAGALHRGWIGIKDALTGDDAGAILGAATSGEGHAISEFERALSDDDLPSDLQPTVRRQADQIRAAKSELEALDAVG